MTKPEPPKEVEKVRDEMAGGRRALKGALVFGVIAATIEIGVLLWFMHC
ncbi:MAG TPA: hypothetical protein VH277_18270 [Gemmatimonadaceae bacterium]|jgi:hypothetical protein|nr:hypothetical protein [Gemmatimonadaceae bacterium]